MASWFTIKNWSLLAGAKSWTPKLGARSNGQARVVRPQEQRKTELTKQPLGNLDGLENDGSGGYYVTDHVGGLVYQVQADGTANAILGGFKGAADIGMIDGKSVILVPRMGEDKLTAYDLEQL